MQILYDGPPGVLIDQQNGARFPVGGSAPIHLPDDLARRMIAKNPEMFRPVDCLVPGVIPDALRDMIQNSAALRSRLSAGETFRFY
jgi:hypothetical protein